MRRALYTSDYIFYDSDTSLCATDRWKNVEQLLNQKRCKDSPCSGLMTFTLSVRCFFYNYVVLYLTLRYCAENPHTKYNYFG